MGLLSSSLTVLHVFLVCCMKYFLLASSSWAMLNLGGYYKNPLKRFTLSQVSQFVLRREKNTTRKGVGNVVILTQIKTQVYKLNVSILLLLDKLYHPLAMICSYTLHGCTLSSKDVAKYFWDNSKLTVLPSRVIPHYFYCLLQLFNVLVNVTQRALQLSW